MKNNAVRHHTIAELMTLLGEQPQLKGIHVVEKCHRQEERKVTYPFRSDHFSLVIVTNGALQLRINLLEYEVKKNDLFLIAPNTIREFKNGAEGTTFAGMMFTSDFLSDAGMSPKHVELFDFFSANNNPVLSLGQEDADILVSLLRVLHRKYAGYGHSVLDREVVNHSFLAFIYEMAGIHRRERGQVTVQMTKKEDLAMRFVKLLGDHFKEERSVFYYADLLYVTPKYLTQTVKEVTGRTAGEMIDDMVIMEAKVLLSDMSHSIGKVAESLYFSDQFFFSKFFKKHTSLTPTEYRKMV